MMKKCLFVCFILSLVLLLAACGSSKPTAEPTAESPRETATETSKEEPAAEPAAQEVPADAVSEEPAAEEKPAAPKAGGSITIAISQDLDQSLDPHVSTSAGKREIFFNIFEGLVKAAPDGSFVPSLAESWEISDDATTFTFKLRDDVKFHNGSELTAEDVIFTLDKCRGAETGVPLLAAYSEIESVTSPDAKTVEIKLKNPNIEYLAYLNTAIIPHDYAKITSTIASLTAQGVPAADAEIEAFTDLSINGDYDDFSGELTGIEYLYGLNYIRIYSVSGLTELNVQSLENVYSITCCDTPDLCSVSFGSSLHNLMLENTAISSIDVTGCPELAGLILSGNSISSIDISNNPELDFVDFSGTDITSVDISANPKLLTAYQEGYYDDSFSRSGYPSVSYTYGGDEICIYVSPDTEIITGADIDTETEDAEETLINTWVEVDGVRYYYDENGELATGLRNINGSIYLFNDNGAMMTGLVYYNGGLFYLGSDGVLQRALINFGGRWYFIY